MNTRTTREMHTTDEDPLWDASYGDWERLSQKKKTKNVQKIATKNRKKILFYNNIDTKDLTNIKQGTWRGGGGGERE